MVRARIRCDSIKLDTPFEGLRVSGHTFYLHPVARECGESVSSQHHNTYRTEFFPELVWQEPYGLLSEDVLPF